MPRMRLGIFGGSFDPFHAGHFLVAQAAMEEACLDRVFFVPAAQSPFKHDDQASSAEHRLRWLRLALQGCSDYFVDDQELQRGGFPMRLKRCSVIGIGILMLSFFI